MVSENSFSERTGNEGKWIGEWIDQRKWILGRKATNGSMGFMFSKLHNLRTPKVAGDSITWVASTPIRGGGFVLVGVCVYCSWKAGKLAQLVSGRYLGYVFFFSVFGCFVGRDDE